METEPEQSPVGESCGERLLTAGEVADLLRVSKSWVYQEADAGRLPSGRFGRALRFRRADIDRYVAMTFERAAGRASQPGRDEQVCTAEGCS